MSAEPTRGVLAVLLLATLSCQAADPGPLSTTDPPEPGVTGALMFPSANDMSVYSDLVTDTAYVPAEYVDHLIGATVVGDEIVKDGVTIGSLLPPPGPPGPTGGTGIGGGSEGGGPGTSGGVGGGGPESGEGAGSTGQTGSDVDGGPTALPAIMLPPPDAPLLNGRDICLVRFIYSDPDNLIIHIFVVDCGGTRNEEDLDFDSGVGGHDECESTPARMLEEYDEKNLPHPFGGCHAFRRFGRTRHFSWDELNGGFKKGNPNRPWGLVQGSLKWGLERTRAKWSEAWGANRPITLTSGYRSPKGNAAVAGEPGSAHMYGEAADMYDRATRWGAWRASDSLYNALQKIARSAGGYAPFPWTHYPDRHLHVRW